MAIKISDGYGYSNKKYSYGYGKKMISYSEYLDQVEKRRAKRLREAKKRESDKLALQTVLEAGNQIANPAAQLMLTPITLSKKIIDNRDTIWKKIKEKIGFKDDHADKNYRR